MKIPLITSLIVVLVFLSGCASHRTELLGAIDQTDKTVETPPGRIAILGPVKRKLTVNGWKIDDFSDKESRYKLSVNMIRTQLFCLNEWSEVAYEILLLDKKEKSEVIRISGESCDSYADVGEAFEAALIAAESNQKP